MRERLLTLGCALGALLLFATLFWHGGALAEREVSLPTSVERGDDGMRGAQAWLAGEGVATLSLRERFSALARHHELAPTGNLLIVTTPAVATFRNDEVVALDRWIRAGNTLLVLAALDDRPAFAQSAFTLEADLHLLTGLSPSFEEDDAPVLPGPRAKTGKAGKAGKADRADKAEKADKTEKPEKANKKALEAWQRYMRALPKPQLRDLKPNAPHPYFMGVARAQSFSDFEPRRGTLEVPRDGFMLALAHEAEANSAAFWVRPDGAGTILVSAFATLFSNRALATADNARLLANIVAATVGAHGSVIFDDEHQGLTAAYDPQKFYRDRRLYATIATLALVWLVWVLGGTQLRLPVSRRRAPRESELVHTTGLFLARVLRPAAAARRMLESFLGRVRRSTLAADEAALWDWLEQHPRLVRAEVQQLRDWQARARAEQRVPLARLHNLILTTERRLAA